MQTLMTIGEAARATKLPTETIRYYEKIGLVPLPPRSTGNYRGYATQDVARLGFVRRARELGFSIDHVRELLDLAGRREHDCCRVDDLTRQHVSAIEQKIADLTILNRELNTLLSSCRGGRVAECRILEALVPAAAHAAQ